MQFYHTIQPHSCEYQVFYYLFVYDIIFIRFFLHFLSYTHITLGKVIHESSFWKSWGRSTAGKCHLRSLTVLRITAIRVLL